MAHRGKANRLHLVVVCVFVTTAEATVDMGEAACPCTHPLGAQPDGECLKVASPDAGAGVCYNNSHGSSCKAWDAGLGPCNVKSPASWCSTRWCYVDAGNCYRSRRKSNWFTNISGLHYSYATCGGLDSYSTSVHEELLFKLHIRISYPGDSEAVPYNLKTVNGNKVGIYPMIMQKIFGEFDMTMQVHEMSNASKNKFSSSYTACVHEVALNRTDLCIGNFWETVPRLQMSPFTTQLSHDIWYLVTFKEDGLTAGEIFKKPFAPFDWWVWFLLLGVTALTSATMYALEASSEGGAFTGMSFLQGMGLSAYIAIVSVFAGTTGYMPKVTSRPARFLNVGFALFVRIIIISYGAQLTKHLMVEWETGTIKSLEAAIKARKSICITEDAQDTFVRLVPQLASLLVPIVHTSQVFEAMDNGTCEVALAPALSLEVAHCGLFTNDARHCNKILTGEPLHTIGDAMPVRPDLQQSMSWAVQRSIASGALTHATHQAKAEIMGSSLCAASHSASSGLQVQDMAGIVSLVGFLLVASLCWQMCEVGARRRAQSRSRSAGEDMSVDKA